MLKLLRSNVIFLVYFYELPLFRWPDLYGIGGLLVILDIELIAWLKILRLTIILGTLLALLILAKIFIMNGFLLLGNFKLIHILEKGIAILSMYLLLFTFALI